MVFLVVVYGCELDHKGGWAPKNWCFWTVVTEKTLGSPWDSKIKPVNPKGNQPWIFTGRTDAEAEASLLWPPNSKSWLVGKYLDAGKVWRQEEKGVAEGEMVDWWWIWANSGRYWSIGKPGMLQSMELQRVGLDLMTKQTRLRSKAVCLTLCKLTSFPCESVF